MSDRLWLRLVRPEPWNDGKKHAAWHAFRRFEIWSERGCLGELEGVRDVKLEYPLEGVTVLNLTLVVFDEDTDRSNLPKATVLKEDER